MRQQKKEIINQRNKIIKSNNFKLHKIFTTNQYEDYKDVVLVYDKQRKLKKVLRVGEQRSKGFFYSGHQGKHLVIPKIYKTGMDKNNQYEIEKYIPGKIICERYKNVYADKTLSDKNIQ